MCGFVPISEGAFRDQQKEGIRSPRARFIDCYELPDVGVENWTWVLERADNTKPPLQFLITFFPLAWCIPKPWDCQVYNGRKHTSPSSACLHSSLNTYFIPSSRSGCLLRNPGYRVSCATQAGLHLVILPTSDSQVLGTQVCPIIPGLFNEKDQGKRFMYARQAVYQLS